MFKWSFKSKYLFKKNLTCHNPTFSRPFRNKEYSSGCGQVSRSEPKKFAQGPFCSALRPEITYYYFFYLYSLKKYNSFGDGRFLILIQIAINIHRSYTRNSISSKELLSNWYIFWFNFMQVVILLPTIIPAV